MGPMTADTILFDLDGTLLDSSYHNALAWARAFAAEDLHPAIWRVHRAIGMGGDKLVAHVTDEQVEERLGERLRDRWVEEYGRLVDETVAFDGAADLVRSLRDRGLKVALATSSEQEFATKGLESLGLTEDDFAVVTTSADAEESKPSPDIFGAALQGAGGTSGLVIGDSTWDIEAARRIGAPTIAVRSGGFGEDELRAAGAIMVADTVADLIDADWDELVRATPPAR